MKECSICDVLLQQSSKSFVIDGCETISIHEQSVVIQANSSFIFPQSIKTISQNSDQKIHQNNGFNTEE